MILFIPKKKVQELEAALENQRKMTLIRLRSARETKGRGNREQKKQKKKKKILKFIDTFNNGRI